jgi:competence protein ComEA
MGLYTRSQLVLLLALLAASGVGLGVRHWRATHPELVNRLESLDREIALADTVRAAEREAEPAAETTARASERRGNADSRAVSRPRTPKRHIVTPDQPGPPLDLNRATPDELMRLPGVGPVLARRIVEVRDSVGRFAAVEDLRGVRGVGRAKLERLRPFIGIPE